MGATVLGASHRLAITFVRKRLLQHYLPTTDMPTNYRFDVFFFFFLPKMLFQLSV